VVAGIGIREVRGTLATLEGQRLVLLGDDGWRLAAQALR
jgi:hypothetical protein